MNLKKKTKTTHALDILHRFLPDSCCTARQPVAGCALPQRPPRLGGHSRVGAESAQSRRTAAREAGAQWRAAVRRWNLEAARADGGSGAAQRWRSSCPCLRCWRTGRWARPVPRARRRARARSAGASARANRRTSIAAGCAAAASREAAEREWEVRVARLRSGGRERHSRRCRLRSGGRRRPSCRRRMLSGGRRRPSRRRRLRRSSRWRRLRRQRRGGLRRRRGDDRLSRVTAG